MKKLLVFLCAISLVFGMAGAASAVSVDFTYTADNIINAWYKNDGSTVGLLTTGSNNDNWAIADAASLDLDIGTAYEIIWQCENSDPSEDWANNPGGFLGEIKPLAQLDVINPLSSSAWEVALVEGSLVEPVWTTLTWYPATEYGANNVSNIWFDANGGPVFGIDGAAQWIWWDENFTSGSPGPGDSVFIRVCVTPVERIPEPATMFLLGTGLIGLAGFSRRRFKK